jgi:hypothetical protein
MWGAATVSGFAEVDEGGYAVVDCDVAAVN